MPNRSNVEKCRKSTWQQSGARLWGMAAGDSALPARGASRPPRASNTVVIDDQHRGDPREARSCPASPTHSISLVRLLTISDFAARASHPRTELRPAAGHSSLTLLYVPRPHGRRNGCRILFEVNSLCWAAYGKNFRGASSCGNTCPRTADQPVPCFPSSQARENAWRARVRRVSGVQWLLSTGTQLGSA